MRELTLDTGGRGVPGAPRRTESSSVSSVKDLGLEESDLDRLYEHDAVKKGPSPVLTE